MERMNKIIAFIGHRYGSFNPFVIAEKLNIDIQYRSFAGEPKGETINFFNRPIILLNNELKYSNSKYFVCAHELGHAIEHVDLSAYYVSNHDIKNKYEYQADEFAISLLTFLYSEDFGELPHTYEDLKREYGLPNPKI